MLGGVGRDLSGGCWGEHSRGGREKLLRESQKKVAAVVCTRLPRPVVGSYTYGMGSTSNFGIVCAVCFGAMGFAPLAYADGGTDEPEAGVDSDVPSTITPGAILAYYCGDSDMRCMMAPLSFDYTHTLAEWAPNWDTGWFPASFPALQIRFVLKMPTDTQVSMAGQFYTTWPSALTMTAPGERFSGFLKIDYGLIMTGRAKIDITLAGLIPINWEGPIPYVPQIDFHLLGMQQFDAWAYPPDSASVSAFTPQYRLFKVNLLDLANIPSTVLEGGIALDIQGEMRATYYTERMVIEPALVPITSDNGETLHNFIGGSYVEVDVYPDGRMSYDGIIHLTPTLYIEVASGSFGSFSIPLYPFNINITDLLNLDLASKVPFDRVRVHVPLPDIAPFEPTDVVDFGKVEVGTGEKLPPVITNVGEATARAVGEVEPSMGNVFKMLSPATTIDPGETGEMSIRFTPSKPGKYETKLIVRSNDPDLPEQSIVVKGTAYDPDDPDGDNWSDGGEHENEEEFAASGDDGGCGCRTAGGESSSFGWLGLLGLGVLGLTRGVAGRGSSRRRAPWFFG